MHQRIVGFVSAVCVALAVTQVSTGAEKTKTRLPEVTVKGGELKEMQSVGAYGQPEWSTHRRFPTTRVYLQQVPWEMGFEQWWRLRHYDDGTNKHRFQEELELGLPHRFQFDLYYNWARDEKDDWKQEGLVPELRWAFADWGKVPMNPTLYAEYEWMDGASDVVEGKLLLGDDLGRNWHWGVNLVCEQELKGEKTRELAVSQAAGYALIDQKLNVGWRRVPEIIGPEVM